MRIYGPYLRKDNRKHICILHDDGRRQTKSYPRYLKEIILGRELEPHETVDHINNDFADDSPGNLQILTRSENAKKEFTRPHRKRKLLTFECPVCGMLATRPLDQVKHNLKSNKNGPFCGRSCAGRFSTGTPLKHFHSKVPITDLLK